MLAHQSEDGHMKPCKAKPGHCPLKKSGAGDFVRHVEFRNAQALAQWNAIQQCRDSLITDEHDPSQVFDSGQQKLAELQADLEAGSDVLPRSRVTAAMEFAIGSRAAVTQAEPLKLSKKKTVGASPSSKTSLSKAAATSAASKPEQRIDLHAYDHRAVIVDPSKKALYDEYRKMSPTVMQARARELSDEDKIALLTSPVAMSSRSLNGKSPARRGREQWGDLRRALLSADLGKADDEQIEAMTHHWDAAVRLAAVCSGRVSMGRLNEMAKVEQYPVVLRAMQDEGAAIPSGAAANMDRKLEPIGSPRPWWAIEAGWAEKGDVYERRYASARLCQDDGWVQNEYWDNSRARRSCIKDPDPVVRLNMARAGYKVKWDDVTDPSLRREFEACDPEANSRLLA